MADDNSKTSDDYKTKAIQDDIAMEKFI